MLPGSGVVTGERSDAATQVDGEGWGVYGFGQKTLERTGTRQDNDRLGAGARYQLNDKLTRGGGGGGGGGGGKNLEGGGAAGKAGVDYQYDDRSNARDLCAGHRSAPTRR